MEVVKGECGDGNGDGDGAAEERAVIHSGCEEECSLGFAWCLRKDC